MLHSTWSLSDSGHWTILSGKMCPKGTMKSFERGLGGHLHMTSNNSKLGGGVACFCR